MVVMTDDSRWRWRYNAWAGVMWGPIPVGWIFLLIMAAIVWVMYYR